MKTTWLELGRKDGESDEDWAAVCKAMAAALRAQANAVTDESAVPKECAPKDPA